MNHLTLPHHRHGQDQPMRPTHPSTRTAPTKRTKGLVQSYPVNVWGVGVKTNAWALLLLTLLVCVWVMPSPPATAQAFFRAPQNEDADQEEGDLAESGASLKTDPDLESLLEKAERYRADGNFRVATKLWQAVLQRSGDALHTRDRQTYFSLVEEVERILSKLSPAGLAAYRITADAEAKEILNASAQGNSIDRKTALSTIVGQYFISSLGDDAAFELGSIYLDRYDFTGALRLFEKIALVYPDPSVPQSQIYLRIALCHSWLGNIAEAETALQKSKSVADSTATNSATFDAVASTLGQLADDSRRSASPGIWETAMGNAARDGVMPSPPKELMQQDLIAVWQFFTNPKDTRYDRSDHVGFTRTATRDFPAAIAKTVSPSERSLIEAWSKKDWRPVGQLLFDEDQLFFRSPADIVAFDKTAIEAAISGTEIKPTSKLKSTPAVAGAEAVAVDAVVSWRSLWRNSFEIDATTRMKEAMMRSWGGYGNRRNRNNDLAWPVSMSEVQYFGDGIGSQTSLYKDFLFAVEGPSYDEKNRHNPPRVNVQWNSTFRRTRDNFLTAYDRDSGKVLWKLPRQSDADAVVPADGVGPVSAVDGATPAPKDYISDGGFMAAPIGYGNLVLVPVNSGGAISVYAIDPDNGGKTVWKSFLCDEPETSAQPWSPIQMSINGSDLFVNCGMGVVFTLDPWTGMVRFAKRYQRSGKQDQLIRRHGWNSKRMQFDGWSSDDILCYGNQIIFFSSDRDSISAIDRRSSEVVWQCEFNPVGAKVDYLIGVYDDVLYAGGYDTIIAYDLKGQGRMLWGATQIFGDKKSRGTAMLTPAGVFVPVGSAIFQYPLKSETPGKTIQPLASVEVNLGTDAPLGNLYSDGNRIYVQGANRLYALGLPSESIDPQ